MTQPVQYFALTKETLQEVLRHLAQHPVAALYEKVNQALPVQQTPASETSTDATSASGTTPAT